MSVRSESGAPHAVRLSGVWRAVLAALLLAGTAPGIPTRPEMRELAEWGTDVNEAIGRAQVSLKPVLLLFTGPRCPACFRLKMGPLRNEELQTALRAFERVELDVSRRSELAMRYRVRGVPAFRVLQPDGRMMGGWEGYRTSAQLRDALDEFLSKPVAEQELLDLVARIKSNKAVSGDWRRALLVMGTPAGRHIVRAAVLSTSTNTAPALVRCLADRNIAVRSGALDLLEELAGNTFGFDPWLDRDLVTQQESLSRWEGWISDTNIGKTVYAPLTAQDFERRLQELLGEDTERSERALRILVQGGQTVLRGLGRYRETHPELPAGAVRKLREAQYALAIPPDSGLNPLASAHRLVWGNQDVQLQTLRQVADCGRSAMPILLDILGTADALAREVAAGAAFTAAGRFAVKPLTEHLERETDPDVIYAVLARLAKVRTRRSLNTLRLYFKHANEDLAIVAIRGAAEVAPGSLQAELLPLLEDSRWRVRVAALKALREKDAGNRNVAQAVLARLDDGDEFVRHVAVTVVARLGIENAAGAMRKAYLKHPDMLGVITSALLAMEKPLPSEYEDALFGSEPGVLLQAMAGLDEVGSGSRALVHRAARSGNRDISCTGLRVLAASDGRTAADNGILIDALRKGTTEQQLTVIQEFDVGYSARGRLRTVIGQRSARNVGPVRRPSRSEGAKVDALLRAFRPPRGSGRKPAEPASAGAGRGGASDEDVLGAIEELMNLSSADRLVRRHAMLLLCGYRHVGAFRKAAAEWSDMVPMERAAVARTLGSFGSEALPLYRKALASEYGEVWRAAVNEISSSSDDAPLAKALFEYLLMPSARLRPSMVWSYGLDSFFESNAGVALPFARRVFAKRRDRSDLLILALAAVACAGTEDTGEMPVGEFLEHENPFIRRIAWIALAGSQPGRFRSRIAGIRRDSSWQVREVIPAWFRKARSRRYIDLYFSEDEHFESYDSLRVSRGGSAGLPKGVLAQLQAMAAQDAEPWVRLQCLLSILSHRVPVDLKEVVAACRTCSRRHAATRLVYGFLDDMESSLGPSFAMLFPLLRTPDGEVYDDSLVTRLQQKWGLKETEDGAAATEFAFAVHETTGAPVMASFDGHGARRRGASGGTPMSLAFFTTPGCKECGAVERWIERMRGVHGRGIRMAKYNIRTTRGLKVNEVLCARFGVPAKDRGVTPAVFMAAGSLCEEELTRQALWELAAKTASETDGDDWLEVSRQELEAASSAIQDRGRAFTVPVVLGAGLLDGVNPCAFATMIFLISYLRVRKRSRGETIQIGIAYVAAVFFSYFVLGLGLADLVSRLPIVGPLGRLVNGLLALGMLVLCLLSLRDGFRCLAGHADEMVLQLPDRLKRGIHTAVRRETARSRYLLAALGLGVVVSVLELACTGQVYVPTIVFMIQTDTARVQAILLLLLYNLAFITPLVGVFAVSAAGTGSETLQRFMVKHMAAVKFALALLFGLLFAAFVRFVV